MSKDKTRSKHVSQFNRPDRKWCFVADEYPNTCCSRRTRFGAWWHGKTGHLVSGRVMRYVDFNEARWQRVVMEMERL